MRYQGQGYEIEVTLPAGGTGTGTGTGYAEVFARLDDLFLPMPRWSSLFQLVVLPHRSDQHGQVLPEWFLRDREQ